MIKRVTLLPLSVLIISNIAFGQYYIGNTAEQIIGSIQDKATMIAKNYDENGQLKLSWVENDDVKYVVYFDGEISFKTYIIPLYEKTFVQWYRVINGSVAKARGKTNTWISYTKTGTFQLVLVYFPGSTVKCFEITKTNEY